MLEVAVVGGGASGTLAAMQLLRQATAARPVRIWLIDQDGRHGLGQAYSTTHHAHLLNAVAAKMSAVPGEPGHLLDWARATMAEPAGPAARLTEITSRVTAIRPGAGRRAARLLLSDGELDADIVILATGNVPARLPFAVPD